MEQWSFAVATDTHCGLDSWATRLDQVISFLNKYKTAWNIKALFIPGDVFMDQYEADMIPIKQAHFDNLTVDYYLSYGNHDRDPDMHNVFGSHCPSRYYTVEINNHKFIVMSWLDSGETVRNFFNVNLTKNYFNVSLEHTTFIHIGVYPEYRDIWNYASTQYICYPNPDSQIFLGYIETLGERHLHFNGHHHCDQWMSPELPDGLTVGVGMGQQTYPHFYQRSVESVWRSHTFPDPNEGDGMRRKPWVLICRVTGTKLQIQEYNAATEEVYLSQTLDYYGGREPCVVKQMNNDLPNWTEEWNPQTRTFQAVFESLPDGLPIYYGGVAKPNKIEGGELIGYDDKVARIKPYSFTVTCKRIES